MLDAYDFLKPWQAPKVDQRDVDRRERLAIFGSESGADRQFRTALGDRPISPPAEICIFEDGHHVQVGQHCPHGLLTLDPDAVTEVDF